MSGIVIGMIALVVIILLSVSVKIVKEYEWGGVLRLGCLGGTGAGLILHNSEYRRWRPLRRVALRRNVW